jgi:hypothetical protein
VSRGNRSRKLDIPVGQFLVVLLWLPVLAAGADAVSVAPRWIWFITAKIT